MLNGAGCEGSFGTPENTREETKLHFQTEECFVKIFPHTPLKSPFSLHTQNLTLSKKAFCCEI